jgi:hypothetical protein
MNVPAPGCCEMRRELDADVVGTDDDVVTMRRICERRCRCAEVVADDQADRR